MPVPLPPVPYKQRYLNADGYLTPAWASFWRELFLRIGGLNALSNSELESLQLDNLQDLEAAVDLLELQFTALNTEVVVNTEAIEAHDDEIQMFLQGPNL